MKLTLPLVLLLLAPAALAQTSTSAKPAGPCERGQSRVSFGGIDMDAVKCQVVLMSNRLAGLETDLTGTQAALALAHDDLKIANEVAAKREKDWADYSKPLWGAAPVAPESKTSEDHK